MKGIIVIIIIAIVAYYFYRRDKKVKECQEPEPSDSQPMQFDLLDENGDPIKRVPSGSPAGKVKVVIGGGDSDAPIQELQYFCIKDKGYHISVWPKNQHIGEYLEFPIAGLNYRKNINKYLGEFPGYLEAEPTNNYDPNAIKILAYDSHHVGYVPKEMTTEIRNNVTLPCPCFCYIRKNNETYFSDCYVVLK